MPPVNAFSHLPPDWVPPLVSSGLAPLYLLPHWPLVTPKPSPRVHTSVLQTRSVTQEGEPLPRPPRKEAAEI